MSEMIPLPPELREFISRTPARSLLVHGPPGSGKTSLALALLGEFPGRRILVTTRVRTSRLLADFPWFREEVDAGRTLLVDGGPYPASARRTQAAIAHLKELLVDPEHSPETEWLWLPERVQEALAQVKHDQPTMLVIDSWNALIEGYLGGLTGALPTAPDRAEVERILLRSMTAADVALVLVVEHTAPSQLDYLLDGVVATGRRILDERTERWLDIEKLRGVGILNPDYPYTLEGGRFHTFTTTNVSSGLQLPTPDPDPAPVEGSLWPGSLEHAAQFGRLPLGGLTTYLIDPGLSERWIRIMNVPLISHVLGEGGRIAHVPPPVISPDSIWRIYRGRVSPEAIQMQVRIQLTGPSGHLPDPISRVTFPISNDPKRPGTPQSMALFNFLQESANKGQVNVGIVWLAGLRGMAAASGVPYSPESFPSVISAYTRIPRTHVVLVGEANDPLMESVRPMASTQIRVRTARGRVFVYGIQPATPLLLLCQGAPERPCRFAAIV
jgi:KaiC/GvpD/RAD55 family RecA-like ATPase